MSEIFPASRTVIFLFRLFGSAEVVHKFLSCDRIEFAVAVICNHCAITAEFELVRTALASSSPYVS